MEDTKCEICLVASYEEAEETRPLMDIEQESIDPTDGLEELEKKMLALSVSSQELRNPTSTPTMQQLTEIKSPPTSTKVHKRSRTTTVSSAASWVPENLTYCEDWLQRVPLETPERKDGKARDINRRKFQIVQQTGDDFPISRPSHQLRKPHDLSIDTDAANNPVVSDFQYSC